MHLVLTLLFDLLSKLVVMRVLPGHGLVHVRLFLLIAHVLIKALRHNRALEGLLAVLEDVRGRIDEVLIFA